MDAIAEHHSLEKPGRHVGQGQLIDASKCYEPHQKLIGNKRVDITEACRNLVIRAYREYRGATYEDDSADEKTHIVCKSRVLDSVSLGYHKTIVETPTLDENEEPVMKKGKPVMEKDTETVPPDEDIDASFKREVLPYNPNAQIVRKNETRLRNPLYPHIQ